MAWLIAAAAVPLFADDADPSSASRRLLFETDVVPILRTYCWKCHGGEGRVAQLDLRTLPLILQGRTSGPAIVRGSAKESRLYQKIEAGEMPPGDALKPTAEHLQIVRDWLAAGALANYEGDSLPPREEPDRDWWAFRRVTRPHIPSVQRADQVRTPIDAFLLQKLEANGLTYSPPADRHSWIRRATFDL
jgi:hypothetical protein